jgi:hypothetical protein
VTSEREKERETAMKDTPEVMREAFRITYGK